MQSRNKGKLKDEAGYPPKKRETQGPDKKVKQRRAYLRKCNMGQLLPGGAQFALDGEGGTEVLRQPL